jgi:DNA end-binding protein Ku
MARIWKGAISFGLVNIPISLVNGMNRGETVRFNLIRKSDHSRIHNKRIAEADEKEVGRDEIVKGYEYEKGKYIAIDPDEIKQLRLKSQKTLEVVQFVSHDEVDLGFFEKPYYVVPKDDSQAKVLAILRKALEDTSTIGLGEITFSGREHLVALAAPVSTEVRGLMLYVMRYEEELRDPADYYSGISQAKVDEKQVALAKQLIESYREPFDASKFKDDYEASLRELVDAKLHHKKPPAPEKEPKRGKVIDLMEALKRSVAAKQGGSASASASAPSRTESTAHRSVARGRKPAAKKRKVA